MLRFLNSYFIKLQIINFCARLGAHAGQTCALIIPENYLSDRSNVCFWGIVICSRDLNALNHLQVGYIFQRDVVFDEHVFPFSKLHPNAGSLLRSEILLIPEHIRDCLSFGDACATVPDLINLSNPPAQSPSTSCVQDSSSGENLVNRSHDLLCQQLFSAPCIESGADSAAAASAWAPAPGSPTRCTAPAAPRPASPSAPPASPGPLSDLPSGAGLQFDPALPSVAHSPSPVLPEPRVAPSDVPTDGGLQRSVAVGSSV